jgi:DNA-binding NarL/FixJ family response regulator
MQSNRNASSPSPNASKKRIMLSYQMEPISAGNGSAWEEQRLLPDVVKSLHALRYSLAEGVDLTNAQRQVLEEVVTLAKLASANGMPPDEFKPRCTDVKLTRRQREVLRLAAEGLSWPEIAGRLVITVNTVHMHVAHACTKLGASGTAKAVAMARRCGLLEID